MNTITCDIITQGGKTSFMPGEHICGSVQWLSEQRPKKARLSLLWYTEGRGDEDAGVIHKENFENPNTSDTRSFDFKLPIGPYSFSGRLISLIWVLELKVDKEIKRCQIVLSPSGNEIDIRQLAGV